MTWEAIEEISETLSCLLIGLDLGDNGIFNFVLRYLAIEGLLWSSKGCFDLIFNLLSIDDLDTACSTKDLLY
jgi:hypothetical protein